MTGVERLKAFRAKHKLTQKDAARELRINLSTWRGYESGKPISENVWRSIELYIENQHYREIINKGKSYIMTKFIHKTVSNARAERILKTCEKFAKARVEVRNLRDAEDRALLWEFQHRGFSYKYNLVYNGNKWVVSRYRYKIYVPEDLREVLR